MYDNRPSTKTKLAGLERFVRAAAFLSLGALFTFLLKSNRIDLLVIHDHSSIIVAVVVSLAVLALNELGGVIADRLRAHSHCPHQPGRSHRPHQPARVSDSCRQKCSCGGNHMAQNRLRWLLINALILMVPMLMSISTTLAVFDAGAAVHRGLKMNLSADYPVDSIVELTGFVARWEGLPENEIVVTRFIVSCCVADAVPIGVTVRWPEAAAFATNSWVYVKGVFRQENRPVGGGNKRARAGGIGGSHIADISDYEKPLSYIQAQIIRPVEALQQPYLYHDRHDH